MADKKPSSSSSSSHPSSSRVSWKGAISFGLVHIPVALHAASREARLDFDWLDRRTMQHVGYKRVNKDTGEEVPREDIARGIAYKKNEYVILSDEEIAAACPKSTHTIEIESFVPSDAIAPMFLERPYWIEPVEHGAKVYALLREALAKSGMAGIARIVLSNREHLAALLPQGAALLLNLLRWSEEVRPAEGLELPPEDAKDAGVAPRELAMAQQLIQSMRSDWNPEQFHDRFNEKIMALVEKKAQAGELEAVGNLEKEKQEPEHENAGAEIIDLTALLQRSLRGGAANVQHTAVQGDGHATKPAAASARSERSKPAAAAKKKAAPARNKSSPPQRKTA